MKRTLFIFLFSLSLFSLPAQEIITPNGNQQLLSPDNQSRLYVLPVPEDISSRYLLLEYSAASPGKLRIEYTGGVSEDFRFFPGNHRQQIPLPVESQEKLTGLSFVPDGTWDSVFLQRAYLSQDIPKDVTFLQSDDRIEWFLSPSDPGWYLEIVSPDGAVRKRGALSFFDSRGNVEKFEIILNQGVNPVFIYRHELSLDPVSLSIDIPLGHSLYSFYKHGIPKEGTVPADPNSILSWPKKVWRKDEYEIFRWSRFDNVYICLFKNQSTQSSYLKRLCFHQEKKWARGKILDDEALSKRRGWYAHDYGADGIADFFSQADREDFPLGSGDLKFRQLALDLGLISRNPQGGYISNGGAFISLQREDYYTARQFYITHEGAHGIFFTHPDYRKFIFDLWEDQSEEAQFVWKSFLWKYSYDTDSEYLSVNEFQAYLIQMKRSSADWYFNDRWRVLFKGHRDYGRFDRFLNENPGYFNETAKLVENYIMDHFGFISGDLGMIRRLD